MRILGLALCFILASVAASDAAVDDPRVAELQATVAKLQGQVRIQCPSQGAEVLHADMG